VEEVKGDTQQWATPYQHSMAIPGGPTGFSCTRNALRNSHNLGDETSQTTDVEIVHDSNFSI
jgi:hypothetical protein